MLIDVTRLLVRFTSGRLPTGIDRVCLAYIREYAASSRAFLFKAGFGSVFSDRASRDIFELLDGPGNGFSLAAVRIFASSPPRPLSRRSSAGRILFNIGHSGLERPSYAAWLREKQVKPVFMVHDLIPITHPEYCRPGEFNRHMTRMRTVLETAAGIITNSNDTLLILAALAHRLGLKMPPAVASPLGSGIDSRDFDSRPLANPYFVMIGTIEARKNHWLALNVWRRLVERNGGKAPNLVVIGQRGWECENALDLMERCKELQGNIVEVPGCSDRELVRYLRHAQALIFPSFVEGYGLPLVEALSLGVPVIASALPVFREVAGNIPEYLDPLDVLGWLACIEDYRLPKSTRRSAQLKRISGFVPPTWQSHFEAVESLIERIEHRPGSMIPIPCKTGSGSFQTRLHSRAGT